ncbi:odorant receptor 4-like [Diorhabda sublineata]|uniref:odorant receptor 4-like n=1 Tax=Diorhabda sublineata TaxID=1163346 RepID=UPI0024E0D0A0|nr:odorant receptor 4-like [Diorhabda sublineata]
MGSVETYFLFKYRTEISTLITQLSQERFQPKNSKQIEIAEKAIKPFTIIRILLQAIIFFSGIFLYISPLATLKTEKSFPYNCWYPFNVSKSPLYQLAYIQQVLGGVYITITKLSTILFLGGIQLYLGVQCDFLCHKIESLGGPYFGKNLKKCILYHESILKIAPKVLRAKMYTVEPRLSGYKKVDADVLFLSGFQLAIMLFLFYYSWFATEVTKKSENIAFAAYSCDWTGKSKEFQKDIMYLIQISQKPIKFHIHGLIGVSLETFLKVLKSSFSYYTVLKNVMQD